MWPFWTHDVICFQHLLLSPGDCGERGPSRSHNTTQDWTLSQPHPFWSLPLNDKHVWLGDILQLSELSPWKERKKETTTTLPNHLLSTNFPGNDHFLSPRTAHTKPLTAFQERLPDHRGNVDRGSALTERESWLMYTDWWLLSTSCSRVKEMGNLSGQKTSTGCVWITHLSQSQDFQQQRKTVSGIFWNAGTLPGGHTTPERWGGPRRSLWVKGAARRLGSTVRSLPSVRACPEVSWVLGLGVL